MEKKKNKNKKLEKQIRKDTFLSNMNDDQREIVRFVIILVVVILFVVGVYFVSKLLTKKPDTEYKFTPTTGEINYEKVSVGMIFNRPLKEYYVVVYDSTTPDAIYYSGIIDNYLTQEKALKVYMCDLDNSLNKSYYVGNEKSNNKAKKLEDLAFGDFTLLKIKDGKIVKYIENDADMKKEWDMN